MQVWIKTSVLAVVLTAGCSSDDPAGAGRQPTPPEALTLKAETVLPPGQSGFFSTDGQAAGSASGDPADYGPHVDDQRLMYWQFNAKPGALGTKPGTAVVPKTGIELYRDAHGVPIVYAETVHDLWFGVGYAIAQDRLFLMDAVRRTGAGTLSALTGCGKVDEDIQQRVVTYSDAEYTSMFNALSVDAKDMVQGYVDGANAWLDVVAEDPSLLPAEYGVLSTEPEPFTVKDVLAAGVYITRFVAAEGGNEFLNIRMLEELQTEYGSRAEALKAFQDMVWLEDAKAVTSVPLSEGTFSNQPTLPADRDAVFEARANWALDLPKSIWKGPGTGHAQVTDECSALNPKVAQKSKNNSRKRTEMLARIDQQLAGLLRKPSGASFAMAIGNQRTQGGGTLLISAPQLGYSYPLLLVEYEIHGAGYHARGVSVPILPTVGIGYSEHLAWALTTGYSKTIDSYIERICQPNEAGCSANQYFHNGVWKNMDCRTETVNYRASSQGLPTGEPVLSTDVEVCRTVHGPIVARDDANGLARSLQFAMFGRELENIEGIREWNRARTFEEFRAGVSKVTWNENVTVATRDGHIAYFHPGLHRARHAETDQRLPIPGTGEFDAGDFLPFAQTPQVVDPAQGYLANWNNKPAFGWLDGEGLGSTSRPGGPGQRVTNLLDKLATRDDWRYEDLREIDMHAGTTDPRAREYLPVIQAFRSSADATLTPVQKAALDLMLNWDRKHYGPDIDPEDEAATDGPAATVFGAYVTALRDELFAGLKNNVIDVKSGSAVCGIEPVDLTVYGRVAGVGSHLFDQSVMDNLVIRILNPASSSLTLRRDYTGGRSRDAVMLAALNTALQTLATGFNGGAALAVADLDKCRRVHPRSRIPSLSEVVGPGSDTAPGTSCVTMPYQDRGSWVHRVGYEP